MCTVLIKKTLLKQVEAKNKRQNINTEYLWKSTKRYIRASVSIFVRKFIWKYTWNNLISLYYLEKTQKVKIENGK